MSEYCYACKASIEPAHDKHYYCDHCDDPRVLFCPDCTPRGNRCPICGRDLEYHSESITRKAFHNPATRGLLGF